MRAIRIFTPCIAIPGYYRAMKRLLVMILALLPIGAPRLAAQQDKVVISPRAFAAYVRGKTLYFAQQGQPYGAEQYLPGNRSIWRYADGQCSRGVWYVRDNQICFLYDGDSDVQCWLFLKTASGYAAHAVGREPESDLDVIWRDDRPLDCALPEPGS